MKIYLGSNSPRRQEILNSLKIPYTPIDNDFDESTIVKTGSVKQYVEVIAREKVRSLIPLVGDNLVLCGDTVVSLYDRILLKPKSLDEACSFLMQLSGKTHLVYSATAIGYKGHIYVESDLSEVTIRELNPKIVSKYFKLTNPLDKAGGYAIQDAGGLIVQSLKGCYYNVMGLSLNSLIKVFKKAGFDLFDFIQTS